jgi:hypothetical protein
MLKIPPGPTSKLQSEARGLLVIEEAAFAESLTLAFSDFERTRACGSTAALLFRATPPTRSTGLVVSTLPEPSRPA